MSDVKTTPTLETQIDALSAGEWTQLSLINSFWDVALTRAEHDQIVADGSASFWGWGGPEIVFRSWTSAAFDPVGNDMYFMGGGRKNYGGNEVYRLDLDTLEWSRVTDPSPLTLKDYDDPNVDGDSIYDVYIPEDAPNTSHNYDGLIWNPVTSSFWYTTTAVGFDDYNGGADARNPSRKAVWELDVDTGEWTQHDASVNHSQGATVFIQETGQILAFHNDGANDVQAYLYDPDGSEHALGRVTHPDGSSLSYATVAFSNPVTGEAYVVSNGSEGIQKIDLDPIAGSITTSKAADLPGLGDLGITFDFAQAGFAYRPVDEKFYVWNGGRNVVSWDPAANEFELIWNEDSAQAPPADGKANDRNFEKWHYLEEHDAFVGVMDGQVFTWKPGGNPADINEAQVGELGFDYHTTGALGVFLPLVGGDKDNDSTAEVSYREAGTDVWKPAMDLLRMRPELNRAEQESPPGYAGSIFGLDAGTDYEIRVEVIDPDGVQGTQVQTLTARTKDVPARDPASATVVDVHDLAGLEAAVENAAPGHVIQVHPGNYTLSNTLVLHSGGTADNPIVIRGLDRSSTVIDAQDGHGILLKGDHVAIEDLSIVNTSKGITLQDADFITVRGNYIQVSDIDSRGQAGIVGTGDDTYIVDNILDGPFEFGRIDTSGGDRGIDVGGHNVEIAYNTLSGFLDAIAGANNKSVGVEIHHNEVLWSTDNGIELDHGLRNISAHHNRLSNTTDALSAQTVAGGPAYIFDNVLLNMYGTPLKVKPLGAEESQGIYFVNNTVMKEGVAWTNDSGTPSQIFVLNNLFLGQGTGDKGDTLRNLSDHRLSELDYNAWLTDGQFRIDMADQADISEPSFADFQANTDFAEHSMLLADENVFANYTLDFDENGFFTFRDPEGTDFTLDANSSAVDAAVLLNNINDAFTGAAPDLGAVETGDAPVHYGARITLEPATAPFAAADEVYTGMDAAVTFDPAANDWDPNGDALTVTAITQPDQGSAVLNADGTVTYTPPAGYIGDVEFAYTVSDADGEQTAGVIAVRVTEPNEAPSAGGDSFTGEQDVSLKIAVSDLLANDSDPNGDNLTITGVSGGSNGSVSLSGGTVTYSPVAGFLGTDSFTYTLSDGRGGTATGNVSVEVLSDGIVMGTAGNDTIDLSAATAGQIVDALSGNDYVTGSGFADEIRGGTGSDSLAGGDGDDLFEVAGASGLDTVSGGNGYDRMQGSDGDDTIGLIAFDTLEEIDGGAGSDVIVGREGGREDWDFSSVTLNSIELINAAGHNNSVRGSQGADRIAAYGNNDQLHGEGGDDIFLYAGVSNGIDVLDGGAGTDRVQGSDGDDDIGLLGFQGIEEIDGGAGYDIISGRDGGREEWDFSGVTMTGVEMIDPGGHHDVVIGSAGDDNIRAGGGNDSVDGGAGRDIVYFAHDFADYEVSEDNGTITVQALVSDEGQDTLSNVEALQFTDGVYRDGAFHAGEVAADLSAPDAPTVLQASGDSLSVAEDGSVTFDPTANDSLSDGAAISGITAPRHGTIREDVNGNLVYTPDADYHGADSFDYTLRDAAGNESTATVGIEVTSVNDAPTATADNARTDTGTPVVIDVLANDRDPDGGSLQVESVTQPDVGSVVINADGTLSYSPVEGGAGQHSFSYTLADGQGGTADGTVTVDVDPVAPAADPDGVALSEDGSVTFDPMANDLLTATSELDRFTAPSNGTVVQLDDGRLTYTPDKDFHGTDSFDYTLRDADGIESTATVTLEVASVNDVPVAVGDSASTEAETAVTIDVLANDRDIDGGTLAVGDLTQPDHGTVSLNGDGTVTYKPYAGVSGVQSFSYTLRDGQGGTATANVAVDVAAATAMTEVYGTGSSELIDVRGADGGRAIYALDGHDTVFGSEYGDRIDGGGGSDELIGGQGDDTFAVAGSEAIDTLIDGGVGRDVIAGSDGNDVIGSKAFAGIEEIDGGAGWDVIRGTEGSREVWDFSAVTLTGIELIDAGGHHNVVRGSQGDDQIASHGGNDELHGEGGDDLFLYAGAGSGVDVVSGGAGTDSIVGSDGDDRIGLLTFDTLEAIEGGAGYDVIHGRDGGREEWDFSAVTLTGIELIDAGGHHNVVRGSQGDDTIASYGGNDELYGEGGDDLFLYAGMSDGRDVIDGGAGSDRIAASAGDDVIGLKSFQAIEQIDAGAGNDVIHGTDGGKEEWDFSGVELIDVELIDVGGHHDRVTGSAGDDHIRGGGGRDAIDGGAGYDVAYFDGEFANYIVTQMEDGLSVEALASDEATDQLSNVEELRFADGSYKDGGFSLVGINNESAQLVYDGV